MSIQSTSCIPVTGPGGSVFGCAPSTGTPTPMPGSVTPLKLPPPDESVTASPENIATMKGALKKILSKDPDEVGGIDQMLNSVAGQGGTDEVSVSGPAGDFAKAQIASASGLWVEAGNISLPTWQGKNVLLTCIATSGQGINSTYTFFDQKNKVFAYVDTLH